MLVGLPLATARASLRVRLGRGGHRAVAVVVPRLGLVAGHGAIGRRLDLLNLVSGGIAFVQVKYHNADGRTRGHRRNYRRNLADMTTFGIDEFWLQAEECGLTPRPVSLGPRNRLDSRYAYYALTKP